MRWIINLSFFASSTTVLKAAGPSTDGISILYLEPSANRLADSGNPSAS